MPKMTEQELEKLLRNNPDVSTDYTTQVPKRGAIIVNPEKVNDNPVKRPKYGNRKVTVEGRTFDSQREYHRYLQLRDQQESGQIDGLVLQPRFVLLAGWRDANGVNHRPISYIADFSYRQDGKTVVEDVKSKPTRTNPVYRLKMKLLLYQHKNDPTFVFREVV